MRVGWQRCDLVSGAPAAETKNAPHGIPPKSIEFGALPPSNILPSNPASEASGTVSKVCVFQIYLFTQRHSTAVGSESKKKWCGTILRWCRAFAVFNEVPLTSADPQEVKRTPSQPMDGLKTAEENISCARDIGKGQKMPK